jgi:hypothetical protein
MLTRDKFPFEIIPKIAAFGIDGVGYRGYPGHCGASPRQHEDRQPGVTSYHRRGGSLLFMRCSRGVANSAERYRKWGDAWRGSQL